jgi:hypothetical protein
MTHHNHRRLVQGVSSFRVEPASTITTTVDITVIVFNAAARLLTRLIPL